MAKRFAIVIGVAAAAVIALGAQPAAAAPHNTRVTITQPSGPGGPSTLIHGDVYSAARKCEVRRRVVVFKQQPGTDRKLGVANFKQAPSHWDFLLRQRRPGWHVYALVKREVRRNGLVCRSDRSRIYTLE